MRRILMSMLAVTLVPGLAKLCPADDQWKPLVTVSLAGYDSAMSDIGTIGQLGGNPNLGKGLQAMVQVMTQGKGLAGLDTKRPWGTMLLTNGQRFAFYGFLPVTDLKQLVDVAKRYPQLEEKITLNDGIYEIQANNQTIYMQQQGEWAVLSLNSGDLTNFSADPLKLLGDLPKKYSLAVRAMVKNVPEQFREQFLAQLQAAVEVATAPMPGESDARYNARSLGAKQTLQQLATFAKEADNVTLGWTIDSAAGRARLDLDLTARAGTELAKRFATIRPGKTNFAGFQAPGAAVTANWTGTANDADVAQAKSALTMLRETLVEQLRSQNLAEGVFKQATHLVDELFALLQENLETRQSDGGLTVLVGPSALTVAGGSVIADGAKVDRLLKELAEEIRKGNPEAAKSIKLNTETYQGVRFHVFFAATPKPELKPLVGDTLEVVVGVGDKRLFAVAGRDAAKTLKEIIDRSQAAVGKEVPPLEIKLAIATIAAFVAQVAEDESVKAKAEMIAGILQHAGKKDHVIITTGPISQGVRMRLEFEEGLLKALGSVLAPMGGPPPKKS